jgi:hypothetical protein
MDLDTSSHYHRKANIAMANLKKTLRTQQTHADARMDVQSGPLGVKHPTTRGEKKID